ncbi:MAG: response regulator [Candidatus Eisenbacteria bacterium]|nr:response regulator [Candidatus Eisenbacteria bacterium]
MKGAILVVDDEPGIRFVYEEYLGDLGFEVHAVGDGVSALREAEACRPVLALVDMNLPDMGGLEVIRRLRETHSGMAVVVISANPPERHLAELASLRVDGALEKPVELEQLGEVARRFAA